MAGQLSDLFDTGKLPALGFQLEPFRFPCLGHHISSHLFFQRSALPNKLERTGRIAFTSLALPKSVCCYVKNRSEKGGLSSRRIICLCLGLFLYSSTSDAALGSPVIIWSRLLLAFALKPAGLIFCLSPSVLDHRLSTLHTHHFPVLPVHHRLFSTSVLYPTTVFPWFLFQTARLEVIRPSNKCLKLLTYLAEGLEQRREFYEWPQAEHSLLTEWLFLLISINYYTLNNAILFKPCMW